MTMEIYLREMLAVTAAAFFGAASAADMAADAQVKSTTEEVLAVIAKTNDRQTLNELAESKVVQQFDFQRMTRLAVGRAWSLASPQQQEALVREFRHLLVRTYVNALAATKHAEASVEVQPPRPLDGGEEVLVKTRVAESGRKPVSIDYHMQKTSTGWKAYDVIVENVSLVVSYRESFAAQVQKGGVDGLIRALAEKNRAVDDKDRLTRS